VTSPDRLVRDKFGMIAEFATAEELLHAAERAYAEGYRALDAYSPLPVHGLAEAMGFRKTGVPRVVLIGAILGAITGYGLQYYITSLAYIHNVGGRPPHSWPAYIPVTFELAVLFASIFGVVGMLALNGLPRPYHPVFYAPSFERASIDSFFLSIDSWDPKYDRNATFEFLRDLNAKEVTEVAS
jgi:hypothetical protein